MLAVLKGFSGSINSAPNKDFNILRGKEFSVFSPVIPLETDLLSSISAAGFFISAHALLLCSDSAHSPFPAREDVVAPSVASTLPQPLPFCWLFSNYELAASSLVVCAGHQRKCALDCCCFRNCTTWMQSSSLSWRLVWFVLFKISQG